MADEDDFRERWADKYDGDPDDGIVGAVAGQDADLSEINGAWGERNSDLWSLPEGFRGEAERYSYDLARSQSLLAEIDADRRIVVARQTQDVLDAREARPSGGTTAERRAAQAQEDRISNDTRNDEVLLELARDRFGTLWGANQFDPFGFAHAAADAIGRAQDAPVEQGTGTGAGGGEASFEVDPVALRTTIGGLDEGVDRLRAAVDAAGGAVHNSAKRVLDTDTDALQSTMQLHNQLAAVVYDITEACVRLGIGLAGVVNGVRAAADNYQDGDGAAATGLGA